MQDAPGETPAMGFVEHTVLRLRRRRFRSAEAREEWLNFLVANEQVDAAARLGWTDGRRPNERTAEQIEHAWLMLEAAVFIQSYARARLAARLYRERLRKLHLFRLYARTEARAARLVQHAYRRLAASRVARRNWRDALDAATPDPKAAAARLLRAAALVQDGQRTAHRAALLAALRGTLHVCTRRFLVGRFRERFVYATDDGPDGAAICWRPWSATGAERRVPIGTIRVHSEVRYEFALEAATGGRAWLFRCPAQHTMEQWVRNLHELIAMQRRSGDAITAPVVEVA